MTDAVEASKIPRILLFAALAALAVAVAVGISRNSDGANQPIADAAGGRAAASEPAATISALEERIRKDPGDVEGWQLLGWSYFENGQYRESANAYAKATQLEPGRAVYWSSLGESLVMSDETDPMPKEAKAAFDRAIRLDPKDPRSRYFLAVSKDLGGDHQGAINDWLALLKDTPKDAPWETDLIRTVQQVGKINNIDVEKQLEAARSNRLVDIAPGLNSVAARPIPGPSKADMAQAAKLPPGQQQEMVASMVSGLEAKLAGNPKNIDGWIMLMRSRMTLGQTTQATAAFEQSLAANPQARSRLVNEARILGVPGA
jgi:cytochrome c-type biogenesis protein CcmH